jgi:hypothetical protein
MAAAPSVPERADYRSLTDARVCGASHCFNIRCRGSSRETVSALNDYLDMEQRWLALARSYEFAERLSRFTAPFSKGKKPKNSRRPDQKEPPRL